RAGQPFRAAAAPADSPDPQLGLLDRGQELEQPAPALADGLRTANAVPPDDPLLTSRVDVVRPVPGEAAAALRGIEPEDGVEIALADEGRQMAVQLPVQGVDHRLARHLPAIGLRGARHAREP